MGLIGDGNFPGNFWGHIARAHPEMFHTVCIYPGGPAPFWALFGAFPRGALPLRTYPLGPLPRGRDPLLGVSIVGGGGGVHVKRSS